MKEKFQLSKELTTTFDLTQNKNVPRLWKGKGVFLLKNFYSNSITKKKDITTVPTTTTGLLALYISESQTISHCLVAPEILSNTWASSWTLTLKGNLNVNFARHDCELANNRAQEFWAFSAPAPEPNFDPAGMTAPAPSPVHNFLKVFLCLESLIARILICKVINTTSFLKYS